MFAGVWILPNQPAQRCAGQKIGHTEVIRISILSRSDKAASDRVVEVRPTNAGQRLRLKGRSRLDRLQGNFIFVAGGTIP